MRSLISAIFLICFALFSFTQNEINIEQLNKLKALSRQLNGAGSNETKFKIQKEIVKLHKATGNDSLAYSNCLILKNYLPKHPEPNLLAEYNFMLGVCHEDMRLFDESIVYLDKSKQIYQELTSHKFYNTLKKIGNVKIKNYQISEGVEDLIKAKEGFMENHDTIMLAETINDIGKGYQYLGNYAKSLEQHFEALKLYELIIDHNGVALAYNRIGIIFKNQKNYDKALEYYRKSLAIRRTTNDYNGIAASYNNIGVVHRRQGKLDEAEEYYLNAIKVRRKHVPDELKVSYSLENLGNLYLDKKLPQKAIVYFDSSLYIKRKFNNKGAIVKSYINLSDAHFDAGNYVKSKEFSLMALDEAEKRGVLSEQVTATSILYKNYKKNNLHEEALHYHELHLKLKDSLFNNNKERIIQNVQQEYDMELKLEMEKEISRHKEETAKQEYETRIQQEQDEKEKANLFSTSLTIGAILLIALAGALWWRFKTEKESKVELEEKNKELQKTLLSKEEKEILLKEIHHRVKNNMQIIMSLLRLQSHNIDNEYILGLYQESQNRIKSMALVHEELYQTNDFRAVSIQNYLEKLISNLIITYSLKTKVDTDIDINVDNTGIDTLVPLGLLINEIISNSLEHGFKGRTVGRIYVKMNRTDSNHIDLHIGDDGVGFPDDFKLENMTSLGMELIHSLVDQLDGKMTVEAKDGIDYHIVFKEQKESIDKN